MRGSAAAAVFYRSEARPPPTREEMSSSSVPTVTQHVISSTPLSISAGAELLVSANENMVYLSADLECFRFRVYLCRVHAYLFADLECFFTWL
jgi:hypothetical protein